MLSDRSVHALPRPVDGQPGCDGVDEWNVELGVANGGAATGRDATDRAWMTTVRPEGSPIDDPDAFAQQARRVR